MSGGLCQFTPHPAHFTDVKFADPPHRYAGEGKVTRATRTSG